MESGFMQKLKMNNYYHMTVREGLKNFLNRCKRDNLSNFTSRTYEAHINIFINFVGEDKEVNEIDKQLIDSFVVYLKEERELKDTSINTYLRSVKSFVNYLISINVVRPFNIKFVKENVYYKDVYSDEELEILLEKPNLKRCTFAEYRTWVYINFLLGTGCRISTATNVKIQDIDFEGGLIKFNQTKNRNYLIVPLSHRLEEVLKEYLAYRQGQPEDYLFCNINGEVIAVSTMQQALKSYNKARGIEKTSSHLFRHTFAKLWILNNGDMFRLQKILGHKSLDMVKKYVNMYTDDLTKDFDKYNPLEIMSLNKKVNTNKINIRSKKR